MITLVTGATGFLGSALTSELVKRCVCEGQGGGLGQGTESMQGTASSQGTGSARGTTPTGGLQGRTVSEVRVLVRDEGRARELFGDAVTVIRGDITDAEQVRRAVEGVTTVYHCVGKLYHPSVPEEVYYRTHVKGTETLLKACEGQGQLRRFVHVSTTGVHGITGTVPAGEYAPFAPTNAYEATKLESELLAVKAYREQGLPVSVVRPGLVYGPGDLHLLGFFQSIKKGLFRVIDGGKALLHPVYIDDMVAAMVLCGEQPQATGRVYNIAGDHPVSIRELATAIAHAQGCKLPAGSIPLWLANLASDIFAITPGVRGERAPLTRSRVAFLTHSRVYDISRARSELGYRPEVGLEEGMRRTAEWYYKQGLIEK